eukprot:366285-Chlamydomonas_euryale.AAC.4
MRLFSVNLEPTQVAAAASNTLQTTVRTDTGSRGSHAPHERRHQGDIRQHFTRSAPCNSDSDSVLLLLRAHDHDMIHNVRTLSYLLAVVVECRFTHIHRDLEHVACPRLGGCASRSAKPCRRGPAHRRVQMTTARSAAPPAALPFGGTRRGAAGTPSGAAAVRRACGRPRRQS